MGSLESLTLSPIAFFLTFEYNEYIYICIYITIITIVWVYKTELITEIQKETNT